MSATVIPNRMVKRPDASHPIAVTPQPGRLRVLFGGEVIADTRCALALAEASYPVAYYVPRQDVRMELLARTSHGSYCPYKGDCSYYTLRAGGRVSENAAWSYEAPFDVMDRIAGHLAFYPNRVDAIEIATD